MDRPRRVKATLRLVHAGERRNAATQPLELIRSSGPRNDVVPAAVQRHDGTDLGGRDMKFEAWVDAESPGELRQAAGIAGQAVEFENIEGAVPRQVLENGARGCLLPTRCGEHVEVIAGDPALAHERKPANLPGADAPARLFSERQQADQ